MEEAHAEREIIEELHEQLACLRDELQGARAREEFLQSLLTADRNLDRESRLLTLLEADRRELQALRPQRHHMPSTHHPGGRPGPPIAASRQPSELHARIVAALAEAPQGLTARQLESVLASPPLKHVLRHLARRGRVVRLGAGKFAVADAVLVSGVGLNGIGP